MMAYLSMMAPRLVELRRVLRSSGSIYLHCDPAAGHYLKMLMDAAFGASNFRNEIVWRRTNAHNKLSKQFGPIHDLVLFFTKSDSFTFHPGRRPYSKSYIENSFPYEDGRGRYQSNVLTGSGTRTGASGKPWRKYDPTKKGRHWAIPAKLVAELELGANDMPPQEVLEKLDELGLLLHPAGSGSVPRYKQYLDTSEGVLYQDIWAYQPGTKKTLFGTDEGIDQDVKWLDAEDEKLGYPTQKPVGLLERIIRSSSDEGGVVLDPFCGCGTAIEAAQKLKRRWIGIDITHLAINLIKHRLRDALGYEVSPKDVIGEPTSVPDAEQLATEDPYQFQFWALGLVGARPAEPKKGADRGIDGRLYFHDEPAGGKTRSVIFSVKAGHVDVSHLRDLRGVLDRELAEMGVLLCLQAPTKAMRTEAASAGFYSSKHWGKYPRLQILTIEEILTGKGIDYPSVHHRIDKTFQKAPRVEMPDAIAALILPLDSEADSRQPPATKPAAKGSRTSDAGRSGDCSGKRTRPDTSANASQKRNGKRR